MDFFFESIRMNVLPHWPFALMAGVFMVVGQVMTTRVFTRERAYFDWDSNAADWFWWWGRETLPLHPIAAGAVLGVIWQNPEMQPWGLVPSMGYFAGAGMVSLFAWVLLKSYWKRRLGIDIYLPGESIKPTDKTPVEKPRK